jgi:DtxR family transcriptional regulator, Mn-dependent transcriptional regulator
MCLTIEVLSKNTVLIMKKLSSNMEDYLEAIYVLKQRNNGVARVGDLAQYMQVKAPSVSSALQNLAKRSLVIHEKYGYVDFTKKGSVTAKNVQRKHQVLVKFLTNILSIDSKTAAEDACKMEHTLSKHTFKKLTKFMEFVETCPAGERPDWLKSFDHYFKTGTHLKCKAREATEKVQ